MSQKFDRLADAFEQSLRDIVPERLQKEVMETIKDFSRDESLALNIFGFGLGYLASRLRRRLSAAEAEALLVKVVAQQLQVVTLTDFSASEEPPPNES